MTALTSSTGETLRQPPHARRFMAIREPLLLRQHMKPCMHRHESQIPSTTILFICRDGFGKSSVAFLTYVMEEFGFGFESGLAGCATMLRNSD